MARIRREPGPVDTSYKAPWSWRWLGASQMCFFVPAVIGMWFEYTATWQWVFPIAAEIVMVVAMIKVQRAHTKHDAQIGTLIESLSCIAALFLLFVPASSPLVK
ncbi:MAG: hypothetical protein J2P17_14080 [Mycobacterium sp.]|nr:hypothetical protein [Mycobacterium sp.]